MEIEKKLVQYIVDTRYEDIPHETVDLIKNVILNVLGALVAGSNVQESREVVKQAKDWGGKKEATILIYGHQVPAYNAAFVNSFMSRTVGYDDSLPRGLHVGGSSVATGLAVAELAGGCKGKEFLTALIIGTEIAARINSQTDYNGFDPTGVCAVFAAAAIASRILGLNSQQVWNALGHAFNRSGGSFQGTIDGSVSARVLQGSASQTGIISAQLSQKGITGPVNFLEGVYGYFHLYSGDKYDSGELVGELGKRFEFNKTMIKNYPSCTTTHSSIDAICQLMEEERITPEQVSEIKVTVTPYAYTLTGRPFDYGDNPKVSAMYSLQYCLANALLRKSCKLEHFDESWVKDPKIMELVKKIHTFSDAGLFDRNRLAMEMEVKMKDGVVYHKNVDFPRGAPANPLTTEQVINIFRDCVNYGGKPLPEENTERIISLVDKLEEMDDVRNLVILVIKRHGEENSEENS